MSSVVLTDDVLNDEPEQLSRDLCIDLYRNNPLGLRLVEALPRFALYGQRRYKGIHSKIAEDYKNFLVEYDIDNRLITHFINSRLFGFGGLYLALKNRNDEDEVITSDEVPSIHELDNYYIHLNPLDPLPLASSSIDQDYNSVTYLEPKLRLNGSPIHNNRIHSTTNGSLIYINNAGTGLVPYAGPSVFLNIWELLIIYKRTLDSIDKIITKTGAIIYQRGNDGAVSSDKLKSWEASKGVLARMRAGFAIMIGKSDAITEYGSNTYTGLVDLIKQIEDVISLGESQTPRSLLFENTYNNGLSDGSNDLKATLMSIHEYRDNVVRPAWDFVDKWLLPKMLSDEYLLRHGEKGDLKVAREKIISEFTWDFPTLELQSEQDLIALKTQLFDLALKARDLGVEKEGIEHILNESDILGIQLKLKEIEEKLNEQQPEK